MSLVSFEKTTLSNTPSIYSANKTLLTVTLALKEITRKCTANTLDCNLKEQMKNFPYRDQLKRREIMTKSLRLKCFFGATVLFLTLCTSLARAGDYCHSDEKKESTASDCPAYNTCSGCSPTTLPCGTGGLTRCCKSTSGNNKGTLSCRTQNGDAVSHG